MLTGFLIISFICTANAEIVDCIEANRRPTTAIFANKPFSNYASASVEQDIDHDTDIEGQIPTTVCECDESNAGELCYLDCSEEYKCRNTILQCRAGDICIVDCSAEESCDGNTIISADTATDVTVICGDDDACQGNVEIYCGTGHCQIFCGDDDSCENTIIHKDRASSFVCTPAMYCQYAASNTTSTFGSADDNEIPTEIPIATTTSTAISGTTESDIFDVQTTMIQLMPFMPFQPYVKKNDDIGNGSSHIRISNVAWALFGSLCLSVTIILFVGLGCYIRKQRMRKQSLKTEMIEYGAL